MEKYTTVSGILLNLVLPEMGNTFYMLLITTLFSMILGCGVALVMTITTKEGLHPNKIIFGVIEMTVDFLMSMPFIILAVTLTPLTLLIAGTSIGKTAALIPLTIATTPIFAKFIYDGMMDVNPTLVQAAISFGASDIQILWVMIKEAMPAIISGTTLSFVTTLSSIAMVGAVGAGGIGSVAIIYGYQRSNYLVIILVVILLAILTQIIQMTGEAIYRKWR